MAKKYRSTGAIIDELLAITKKEANRVQALKKEQEEVINKEGLYMRQSNGAYMLDIDSKKIPSVAFELYQMYSEQYIELIEKQTDQYRKIKKDQTKERQNAQQLKLDGGGL